MKKIYKGSTLVEVLLNLSIVAVFIIITAQLFSVLLSSNEQGQSVAEVNQQGVHIMQLLTYSIRTSESITTPVSAESGNTIEVVSIDPLKNPIIIALDNNNITLSEGGRPAFNVNSDRVKVESLSFSNYSAPGTNGSVRIEFTILDNFTGISYSKTFTGAATIR